MANRGTWIKSASVPNNVSGFAPLQDAWRYEIDGKVVAWITTTDGKTWDGHVRAADSDDWRGHDQYGSQKRAADRMAEFVDKE